MWQKLRHERPRTQAGTRASAAGLQIPWLWGSAPQIWGRTKSNRRSSQLLKMPQKAAQSTVAERGFGES